jgi:hypothetical protein
MFSGENKSRMILYQANTDHLCCELNGEAVILSLKNGKYYGLNSIGAVIWGLLQKPISVSKIGSKIMSQYDVEKEECIFEVENFLAAMRKEGLVEIVNVPVSQVRQPEEGGKETIF